MMTFKCKMCGGDLSFEPGASVAECPYCGTLQTLPKLDDDKRANLYDRANHFRRQNEYDKAMAIYEQILAEDRADAEAYWSLVLCRYGIEYVEDPATRKRVPTVNRVQYASILADEDYKAALQYADAAQRSVYEAEAAAIAEIQKGILDISKQEQPFDVFICYKETDANGRRTPDSVLANDMYHQLTKEGFKVFFSRITLEDKIGTAYEPYIFAALNSARVMVVLGTKPEYFNAVWVKNEWSRYLALIRAGADKTLVPAYRDMDPYDLPEEFAHLQAQDMGKLGFMQDLIRGVKKISNRDEIKPQVVALQNASGNSVNIVNLMKRAHIFIEDGDWKSAGEYLERVLDENVEYAPAYVGKVQIEYKQKTIDELCNCLHEFENSSDWQKAIRFADAHQKETYEGYVVRAKSIREEKHKEDKYNDAVAKFHSANTIETYKEAESEFLSLSGFKDADEKLEECKEHVSRLVYEKAENILRNRQTLEGIVEAECLFATIIDYKNVSEKLIELREVKSQLEYNCQHSVYVDALKKYDDVKSVEDIIIIKEELQKIASHEGVSELLEKCDAKYVELTEYAELCLKAEVKIANMRKQEKEKKTEYEKAFHEVTLAENAYEKAKSEYEESMQELSNYQSELKNLRGLFTGKRRKELERIIGQKEEELSKNKKQCIDLEQTYMMAKMALDSIPDIREITYTIAREYLAIGFMDSAWIEFNRIPGYKDSDTWIEDKQLKDAYHQRYDVGHIFRFGRYPQETNSTCNVREIEWIVLANDGKNVTMLSKHGLTAKPYNSEKKLAKWEVCSLRTWLNQEFYNSAFSGNQKQIIKDVPMKTQRNSGYRSGACIATTDKVFLLTIDDAKRYFPTNDSRIMQPTSYAKSQGVYTDSESNGSWWLRSQGVASDVAAFVNSDGSINSDGIICTNSNISVRPAIVIGVGGY